METAGTSKPNCAVHLSALLAAGPEQDSLHLVDADMSHIQHFQHGFGVHSW